MHRCLYIVEVQRAIFREINYDSDSGRGRLATLAGVARTCRAFSNAALDLLWAELNSFVYLVKCLPRDLWSIEPLSGKVTFQRPMSLKDWEVFFGYSFRVRTLLQSVGPTGRSDLGDDVIFALSNPPTYGPLIPYLKALYWDKPNRKYASLLRLLLTPSLVTLSLSNCVLPSYEASILASIGAMCPSLKYILPHTSFTNILGAGGKKILSEVLLHLHFLESIECPALNEAAINHLAHLPHLVSLSLELPANFQLESVRLHVMPPSFASIEVLKLHASALSTLTSLLEFVHLKPHSVSFVVASEPTPDALRLFFLALANACGSERLSQISLITASERQRGIAPQQVTLSTFQSLLALPSIEGFDFDVPWDVALDDDAIKTLATRWPRLSSLPLNARSGWGTESRVTHKGLIKLLAGCQALASFALAVNFMGIDVSNDELPASRPGKGVVNNECLIADFVTSTITSPVAIAAFLSDICPEVEMIKSWWSRENGLETDIDPDEVDAYRERWEEVENLLPAFCAVRKQCMAWAKKVRKGSATVPA